MLTTDDVREFVFGPMRTAYGSQWKHGDTAAKVWRNALSQYPCERIQEAANAALGLYVDHPPTLPQFLQVLKPQRPQANTYLPPPQMSKAKAVANKVLMRVLMKAGGVDDFALANMVALKNALVEEFLTETGGDDRPTREFVGSMHNQLSLLAQNGG